MSFLLSCLASVFELMFIPFSPDLLGLPVCVSVCRHGPSPHLAECPLNLTHTSSKLDKAHLPLESIWGPGHQAWDPGGFGRLTSTHPQCLMGTRGLWLLWTGRCLWPQNAVNGQSIRSSAEVLRLDCGDGCTTLRVYQNGQVVHWNISEVSDVEFTHQCCC